MIKPYKPRFKYIFFESRSDYPRFSTRTSSVEIVLAITWDLLRLPKNGEDVRYNIQDSCWWPSQMLTVYDFTISVFQYPVDKAGWIYWLLVELHWTCEWFVPPVGLSEVLYGLGFERLAHLMPDVISTTEKSDLAAHVKEGYLMLYLYLPSTFGAEFTPFIGAIIPSILKVCNCGSLVTFKLVAWPRMCPGGLYY